MSGLLLNCEDPQSAKRSLAQMFNMSDECLIEELRSIEVSDFQSGDDLEEILLNHFSRKVDVPSFAVIWFHGAKLALDHSIHIEGLLPAHLMRDRLAAELKQLSAGLAHSGGNPFSISSACKPAIEGPFGFLCRDAAAHPRGLNGGYVECPELIQDIAGELLGGNYEDLVLRFNASRHSCVVHFEGAANDYALGGALRYAYESLIEGRDSVEAANSVSVCFDGGGEPVPPSRIVRIEILSGGLSSEFNRQ